MELTSKHPIQRPSLSNSKGMGTGSAKVMSTHLGTRKKKEILTPDEKYNYQTYYCDLNFKEGNRGKTYDISDLGKCYLDANKEWISRV